ncbi:transposase domain-containing protein, partial [Corallococcus sp. AB011P]|uniref:transposase domain-containing protein n=2 Tax=unclassified Corallococcus TaxID=2685029 RepID=UPI001F3FEC0A
CEPRTCSRQPRSVVRAREARASLCGRQHPEEVTHNETPIALGRKNFLFVGHEAAGENLAGLYALVATCEANGVNPEDYLADVLLRVQTHPHSRIGELLPHEWKRRRAADPLESPLQPSP